jgi:putative membrane protein
VRIYLFDEHLEEILQENIKSKYNFQQTSFREQPLMLNHKFAALVATGAFLSLGTGAIAQQTPAGGQGMMQKTPMQNGQMQMNTGKSSAFTSSDKQFLTKSAQGSIYELASAKLALQKTKSTSIKQYASRIIKDHTTYNKQLMKLAAEKKVTLPLALDAQNKSKLDSLQKLRGAAFDRQYIQETTQANVEDLKDMQKQSSTTKDTALQAFIAEFLPVQQEHSQLASALKSGSPSATNPNSSNMR